MALVDIYTLKAGEEVISWCGKCKEMRIHRVLAAVPKKIPRSTCLTCDSVHQVKLYKPGEAPKRAKKTDKEPAFRTWEVEMDSVHKDDAKPYKMSEIYEVDCVVDHAKFGLGKVLERLAPHKIRVLFESGLKIMLQDSK